MKTDWKKIPKNSKIEILTGDVSPYFEEHDGTEPEFVVRGYVNGSFCRIGLEDRGADYLAELVPVKYAPAEKITMRDLEESDE